MPDQEQLEAAVREELADLWHDLQMARHYAYEPGTWTMACINLEERIKRLTPLVGPTPWEDVQIMLLKDGIYQRIHRDLGIEVEVDMEQVAQTRAYIEGTLTEQRR